MDRYGVLTTLFVYGLVIIAISGSYFAVYIDSDR